MFKSTNRNLVIRLVDNANIPFDEENKDYQEYLEWLAEGNLPEPFDQVAEDLRIELAADLARIAAIREEMIDLCADILVGTKEESDAAKIVLALLKDELKLKKEKVKQ